MHATKTKDGFFIPKDQFKEFDNLEIISQSNLIIIKPKSLTDKTKGIIPPFKKPISEIIHDEEWQWSTD
ncbi:MAG: hypothetical protein AB1422_03830 [bacterium]